MGNSPGFPEAQSPYPGGRRLSDKAVPKNGNFELRWHRFIESLDVTDEKMKLIEQLPYPRKMELVLNYQELNTVKFSPAHCVENIKMARIAQITASKRKQDHDDFRKVFTSAEISLRTNKIETDTFRSTQLHADTTRRKGSMPVEEFAPSSLARRDPSSPAKSKNARGPSDKPPPTPNFSLSRNKSASPTLKSQNMPLSTSLTLETLKDCLHLCLKCFKTLLNNQDGCTKAFENPEVIEIITFCILHPNYATKALALDLLSAICLIGGGHPRVLKAFDHFRCTIGENACFETVMNDFRVHEDLPLDQYNLEYSVACIQFINIVVHSPENINLRVYLQYAFTLLGLDDFLRALQARPGDKLNRHVEAYVNNMVNCSLLLDDAEAKEAAVEEVSRLEAALEVSENTAKQQAASFKQRDIALSELVESLRGKIRDINVAAGQQEAASKRITELEQSLAAAHRQIQRLQDAAAAINTTAVKTETNSLGQVRPAPNPRQKKPSVCNMTTSTTLPMGFEFAATVESQQAAAATTRLNASPPTVESRRKSISLEMLSTANRSTMDSGSDTPSTFPLSSGAASSRHSSSSSEVNYDTFSRKSGSIAEKPRHGLISCTLISQVSDMALARKTFANLSTNLSVLVSRLASTSCPTPPCPAPAVPLPRWHASSSTTGAAAPRLRYVFGCGGAATSASAQRCHQLATVLPDPWATCFASAHRAFRLCTGTGEVEEAEKEEDAEGQVEQAEGADNTAVRLLQWLVSARLVTKDAIRLEAPMAVTTVEDEADQRETVEATAVLPLVTALLSVSLNPFVATRLLSLLEAATAVFCDGNGGSGWWSGSEALPRLFDAVEAHLRVRLVDRDLANSPVYQSTASADWPLLQALLQVNLLPFVLTANLQLLIEQLSTLSACCNSIVVNTKLPTVLRIAENLAATFLGKPDFLILEGCDFSSLADWWLLMRRKSIDVDVFADSTSRDSPCVPRRSSEGVLPTSATTHRRKPFMEALYKAVELVAPEALDWTHDIVHLDAASRVLPSDMRDRLRELEYGLSLRDALFPAPEIPGHLQYLTPDAWAKVGEVKTALTEVEILIGAAAHCIYSVTGPSRPPTFSDRDFATEMASFARFYSSFKKWTSDAERRVRNLAKASSCKVPTSVHRRNGAASDSGARRQRSGESASRSSRNGHDEQGSDCKRHNSRHLNTVGIMDNILAGLDSEPLYADIHRVQVKGQQNVPSVVTNVAAATPSSPAFSAMEFPLYRISISLSSCVIHRIFYPSLLPCLSFPISPTAPNAVSVCVCVSPSRFIHRCMLLPCACTSSLSFLPEVFDDSVFC
ncbi:formin [Echinococcus multilocularis]|uniref:Formin n=1 Tax=Echinococcus multilocularis TaxID=6211 RepID=A0A068YDK5_ECHMU|nr:formin [Echinococcus multilocularis]